MVKVSKASVSLPPDLLERAKEAVDGSRYRNLSHLIQVAIEHELEE
ncbi:MAG: hypothetical protein WBK88_00085 [Methanothrix sp.]